MSEKYVVTWDMLQIHARKLANRLMPSEQWKGIIAVISASTVYNLLNYRNSLNCFHFFNDLILYLAKFV